MPRSLQKYKYMKKHIWLYPKALKRSLYFEKIIKIYA